MSDYFFFNSSQLNGITDAEDKLRKTERILIRTLLGIIIWVILAKLDADPYHFWEHHHKILSLILSICMILVGGGFEWLIRSISAVAKWMTKVITLIGWILAFIFICCCIIYFVVNPVILLLVMQIPAWCDFKRLRLYIKNLRNIHYTDTKQDNSSEQTDHTSDHKEE